MVLLLFGAFSYPENPYSYVSSKYVIQDTFDSNFFLLLCTRKSYIIYLVPTSPLFVMNRALFQIFHMFLYVFISIQSTSDPDFIYRC